jgi:hypothetical protein
MSSERAWRGRAARLPRDLPGAPGKGLIYCGAATTLLGRLI